MQKKIIALAIVAAFSAPAFADVTVYGIVDAAVANTSKTGYKGDLNVISGGLSTSRLGVKTVEDLGNGMKAIAVLEYKLDVANSQGATGAPACTVTGATPATTGTPATCSTAATTSGSGILAARQQIVGLAGDFGTVAAGYAQTTGYDFSVKFDPTAGSAVDTANAVNKSTLINTSARAPHALAYISPSFGGVTVAVNRSFDVGNTGAVANATTTTAGNKTTANLVSVTYDGGPLAVGGVYAATANDGAGYNKVTDLALGVSYDLTVVKLFGAYTSTKTANGLGADTALAFHAVAPVGPGAVVFTYGKNTVNSTAAADNTSGFTVAYLQDLSKTTTVYGAVQKLSLATTVSVDTTVLAVGLRKKF